MAHANSCFEISVKLTLSFVQIILCVHRKFKNLAIGNHFHEAHGRRDLLKESHFKILRRCQGKFDC